MHSHPLKSPKSPYLNSFASQQSSNNNYNNNYSDNEEQPRASTSSLTPTSSHSDLIRRRGSSTNLSSNFNNHSNNYNSHNNSHNNSDVDSDITRPSLRRVTATATNKVKKVGESKARRSFDELSRSQLEGQADREVVIHELVKTDSIASISLSYGITPQALRLSNRLWPSDSIHLRKTLNIPLDQCHLPSSSGIERISREEDGNLVVWERERVPSTTSSNGYGSALGLRGLSNSRRAASASTLDLSRGGTSSAGGSTYDLLGSFSDVQQVHRSSLDSFRDAQDSNHFKLPSNSTKNAPSLLIDGEDFEDAVSGYLPSTNNPYAFSSAPPSPPPPPLLNGNTSPSTYSSNYTNLLDFNPPSRINSPDTNTTDSVPPSPTNGINPYAYSDTSFPSPPIYPTGSLSRRTLQVSKVPSSSLSFFPPPNPSFHSPTTEKSSNEELFRDPKTRNLAINTNAGVGGNNLIGTTGNGSGARKAKRSVSGTSSNGSSSNPLETALGLLNLSNNSNSSNSNNSSSKHWSDRWNLSYFGEEGGEFSQSTTPSGGGVGGGSSDYSNSNNNRPRSRGSEHELDSNWTSNSNSKASSRNHSTSSAIVNAKSGIKSTSDIGGNRRQE